MQNGSEGTTLGLIVDFVVGPFLQLVVDGWQK